MQRYFNLTNNLYSLEKEDVFHIEKVMRMKINDLFQMVFNNETYLCKIIAFNPFKYEIIKKLDENNELNGYLRLLYCLPKGEKTDLVIQKATELGVNEIVLINSSRSIAKIDDKNKEKKLIRFNKIIKEASEQSKRNKLMILNDVISFNEIKKYKADYSFIAFEKESKNNEINILKYINDFKGKTINILIGPEGGFSDEEVEYSLSLGYNLTSLGKRILRSETACFSLISLISYYLN